MKEHLFVVWSPASNPECVLMQSGSQGDGQEALELLILNTTGDMSRNTVRIHYLGLYLEATAEEGLALTTALRGGAGEYTKVSTQSYRCVFAYTVNLYSLWGMRSDSSACVSWSEASRDEAVSLKQPGQRFLSGDAFLTAN